MNFNILIRGLFMNSGELVRKSRMKKIIIFFIFLNVGVAWAQEDEKSLVHSLINVPIYSKKDGIEDNWVKTISLNGKDFVASIVVDKEIKNEKCQTCANEKELSFVLIDKVDKKIVFKTSCIYPSSEKWLFTSKLKNDDSDQFILCTSVGAMLQSWRVFGYENNEFQELGSINGCYFEIKKTPEIDEPYIEVFKATEGNVKGLPSFYKIENDKIINCSDKFVDEYVKCAEQYKTLLNNEQGSLNLTDGLRINELIVYSYIMANQKDVAQEYVKQAHGQFGNYKTGHMSPSFINRLIANFDNFAEQNGLNTK
jgi:hypothetical protein